MSYYPAVAGIDPSLTSTGVAVWEDGAAPWSTAVTSKGKRADLWSVRVRRVHDIVQAVSSMVPAGALVIVEGPAYGHGDEPGFVDRAALIYEILGALMERGLDFGIVPPQTLKRWATGSGAASKAAVSAVVRRAVPGMSMRTDDESDAAAMMLMAAQKVGWLEQTKRSKFLDSVEWNHQM